MLVVVVSVATSLVVFWSLWSRRRACTWRCRWETATTLSLGFFILTGILIWQPAGGNLSLWLYRLGGPANCQFFLAGLGFLGAICAMAYSAITKLTNDPDGEPRHKEQVTWFRRWILIPVLISDVVTLAFFSISPVSDEPRPDFETMYSMGPCSSAYWVLYAGTVDYVLYQAVRAYLDLWQDKRSRRIVEFYLVGCGWVMFGTACRTLAALIRPAGTHLLVDTGVMSISLGVATFALGAAYGWRTRLHWFTRIQDEVGSENP